MSMNSGQEASPDRPASEADDAAEANELRRRRPRERSPAALPGRYRRGPRSGTGRPTGQSTRCRPERAWGARVLDLPSAERDPLTRDGRELIVITGPPGAGKSSASEHLVNRFEPSALVAGDSFFAMIKQG